MKHSVSGPDSPGTVTYTCAEAVEIELKVVGKQTQTEEKFRKAVCKPVYAFFWSTSLHMQFENSKSKTV